MKKKQSFVAYTIIVERDDGKPMFLVEKEEKTFSFPSIEANRNKSGLSQIIDEIKHTLKNLNFDELELSELTNAVIDGYRIPIFVLKYRCEECVPEDLLLRNTKLEWQISDNFKETLQKYEISGVPLF